jgi:hypothetical protein
MRQLPTPVFRIHAAPYRFLAANGAAVAGAVLPPQPEPKLFSRNRVVGPRLSSGRREPTTPTGNLRQPCHSDLRRMAIAGKRPIASAFPAFPVLIRASLPDKRRLMTPTFRRGERLPRRRRRLVTVVCCRYGSRRRRDFDACSSKTHRRLSTPCCHRHRTGSHNADTPSSIRLHSASRSCSGRNTRLGSVTVPPICHRARARGRIPHPTSPSRQGVT